MLFGQTLTAWIVLFGSAAGFAAITVTPQIVAFVHVVATVSAA